jgi:hypothetical protein
MKLDGYLEHLDLGIDLESGERGILVKSANEFFQLSEAQQHRAWSVVKVASEISERPAITIYQHAYKGKIPSKVIKKSALHRHGLTLVKPYESIEDRRTRRANDQHRISKTLRRVLSGFTWVPKGHRELIVAIVSAELRHIEQELFGKGEEGKHEATAA